MTTVGLVNALEQEMTANRTGQLADRLLRLDLVILDEIGYLPFSSSGSVLLFHLLSKLYERTERAGSYRTWCKHQRPSYRPAGRPHPG